MSKQLKNISTLIRSLESNAPDIDEDEPEPSRRVPGLWNSTREANGYSQFDLYIQDGIAESSGKNITDFIERLFNLTNMNSAVDLTLRIFSFGSDPLAKPTAYKAGLHGRRVSKAEIGLMLKWLGNEPQATATLSSYAAGSTDSDNIFIITKNRESLQISEAFTVRTKNAPIIYCNPLYGWENGREWSERRPPALASGPSQTPKNPSKKTITVKLDEISKVSDFIITITTCGSQFLANRPEKRIRIIPPGIFLTRMGQVDSLSLALRPNEVFESATRHNIDPAHYQNIVQLAVMALKIPQGHSGSQAMDSGSTELTITIGNKSYIWNSDFQNSMENKQLDNLIQAILAFNYGG